MRTILFRGKSKATGEWVTGYYAEARDTITDEQISVIFPIGLELYPRSEFSYYEKVIPETIGQFTGLLDKNGNNMVEGDIVEFEGRGYIPFTERGEVVFHEGSYHIFYRNEFSRYYPEGGQFHQIGKKTEWQEMGASGTIEYTYEILGNIHDNPALMPDLED